MKPVTVLFTGAGGAGTIYLLRKFKSMEEYRTVSVDMNPYAVGLYVADRGLNVPPVTSPNYFDVIAKIINEENVNIVVPLIDEELLGMIKLGEQLGIPVLLPEKNFVSMGLDKLETARKLREKGITAPETWTYEEFEKITDKEHLFPLISKPRWGRGSRGFILLENIEDYKKYINHPAFDSKNVIFQDFIEGKEYTVSVTTKKNGEIIAVVPKEVVVKKGITKVGITRENKSLEELCQKIQQELKADGPFNVQLIVSKKDGLPYVHEINPRFSTTVVLTTEAGINEVDILIKDRLGIKPREIKQFQKNLVMLRYDEQIFLDVKDLEKVQS